MSIQFSDFKLHPTLLDATAHMGYLMATPVQEQVLPHALAGSDLMVSSQTGSGKTAAFLLPVLDVLLNNNHFSPAEKRKAGGRSAAAPAALVLCPTRELAQQVAKEAIRLKGSARGIRVATIVGGMPYRQQILELKDVSILVATPGRLLDLHRQKMISFDKVKFFIADEADRMLDLGFAEDLQHLRQLCHGCEQTLMFSATFPDKIMRLAAALMDSPKRIELATATVINKDIHQCLNWTDSIDHQDQLLMHWLRQEDLKQAVVFTSTQIESEKVAAFLEEAGFSVTFLHGGIPQKVRNRRLDALRRERIQILVATDVAARGIDVSTITHVINYGLPMKPEDYVHRIGRTGRAGRTGMAITLANSRDQRKLAAIEKYTAYKVQATVVDGLEPRFKLKPAKDSFGAGTKNRQSRNRKAKNKSGADNKTSSLGHSEKNMKRNRMEIPAQKFFGSSGESSTAKPRNSSYSNQERSPAGGRGASGRNESGSRRSKPSAQKRNYRGRQ